MYQDAIILAAGRGVRLAPYTQDAPKPMTEVCGKSILANALSNIAEVGGKRAYIVTGYKNQMLIEHANQYNAGLEIVEIYSPRFATTNNMYSLWLARQVLSQGCLLLEGDVFFDTTILPQLKGANSEGSYWFADIFKEGMNGCMLTADGDGAIRQLEIIREQKAARLENVYKSIGILAITAQLGRKIVRWLEQDIASGRTDVYYDLVLADHLHEANLSILDISSGKWMEIDDAHDLLVAEGMFRQ